MTVLGTTEPDPIGVMLDTGYMRFVSSTGIEGLAKTTGRQLDVLAVVNPTGKPSSFRNFIAQAKTEFDTINVWVIENPVVADALKRYGFTPETMMDPDGVPVEG